MNIFPNNTIGKYTTKLPLEIDLTDHEIGLVEIVYPHKFFTLTRNDFIRIEPTAAYRVFTVKFEDRYFSRLSDLVAHLVERCFATLPTEHGELLFSAPSNKLKIVPTFDGELLLTDSLAGMLGVPPRIKMYAHQTFTGEYAVDLGRGLSSLFVYTNIIHPRIVGGIQAPLLRITPITGEDGDIVCANFDRVQYFAVNRSDLSEIQIFILDQGGVPIPFRRGALSLTLHARKRGV